MPQQRLPHALVDLWGSILVTSEAAFIPGCPGQQAGRGALGQPACAALTQHPGGGCVVRLCHSVAAPPAAYPPYFPSVADMCARPIVGALYTIACIQDPPLHYGTHNL